MVIWNVTNLFWSNAPKYASRKTIRFTAPYPADLPPADLSLPESTGDGAYSARVNLNGEDATPQPSFY